MAVLWCIWCRRNSAPTDRGPPAPGQIETLQVEVPLIQVIRRLRVDQPVLGEMPRGGVQSPRGRPHSVLVGMDGRGGNVPHAPDLMLVPVTGMGLGGPGSYSEMVVAPRERHQGVTSPRPLSMSSDAHAAAAYLYSCQGPYAR